LTHQAFTLKKPPLTFVSAANETGRASTLEIRVDNALWSELPALGQAGPEDAVYEVRQSDDGNTHVRFGDGVTGRRLPTGALNVKAVYRSGIGLSGEVPEEAISQLRTRPLGVRAVVNPSPATGAADAESMDRAKLNAPGTVKTLGRIVSLTDYEDFAGAFAGVGKAQARELWSGQEKVVHLTVAPEADAELTQSAPLIMNLTDAIEGVRDPARPVIVQPFQRRFFTLTARLEVDPAYLAEDVTLWVRESLQQLFGYDTRKLAQSVSAAELISALHSVRGVLSTDLDALAILLDGSVVDTSGAPLQAVLPAFPALGPGQRGTSELFTAAELLTVLPSAITLTTMEASDA
jgi:predicted phage baseplate assembly protein